MIELGIHETIQTNNSSHTSKLSLKRRDAGTSKCNPLSSWQSKSSL